MSYLTIELKTNDQGGTAAAATSGRPCHAAIILQGYGTPLEYKAYTKEASE